VHKSLGQLHETDRTALKVAAQVILGRGFFAQQVAAMTPLASDCWRQPIPPSNNRRRSRYSRPRLGLLVSAIEEIV